MSCVSIFQESGTSPGEECSVRRSVPFRVGRARQAKIRIVACDYGLECPTLRFKHASRSFSPMWRTGARNHPDVAG